MIDKEKKIEDLRQTISYLTEKLKVVRSQVERGEINDKILAAKKEIGILESKSLDRIRKVDIIDAPSVADRLEAEKHKSRTGLFIGRNRININF